MSTLTARGDVDDTQRVLPRPKRIDAIPMGRIVGVELRKMFDTRSGFWLMASIAIAATLATGAVILFASDSAITYDSFGAAIGVPMTVLLPVVAILSVTSEWSQRSGLTTFTLVPHRGRIVTAKLAATLVVGVTSMLVALGIGALGNVLGSTIKGVDTVWDISLNQMLSIILANMLGMLVGFMLGVLIRNSAGAIVGYFVFAFVLPTLSALLAGSQAWFRDLQPWIDFNFAQSQLYEGALKAAEWAHLGVTSAIWVLVPLLVGIRLVLRSAVK